MQSDSQTEIADEISRFIREDSIDEQSAEEIGLDENLFTSGILDSMGAMRLISHLQSKYDYTIPPTDLVPENFKTIQIMSGYLAQRLPKR